MKGASPRTVERLRGGDVADRPVSVALRLGAIGLLVLTFVVARDSAAVVAQGFCGALLIQPQWRSTADATRILLLALGVVTPLAMLTSVVVLRAEPAPARQTVTRTLLAGLFGSLLLAAVILAYAWHPAARGLVAVLSLLSFLALLLYQVAVLPGRGRSEG